jgi:hypothetical protein
MLYIIVVLIAVAAVYFSIREKKDKDKVLDDKLLEKLPNYVGESRLAFVTPDTSGNIEFDILKSLDTNYLAQQNRILNQYLEILEQQRGTEAISMLPFPKNMIENAIKYQAVYCKRNNILTDQMIEDVSTIYSRLAWFIDDEAAMLVKNVHELTSNNQNPNLEQLMLSNEICSKILQQQIEYYKDFREFSNKFLI